MTFDISFLNRKKLSGFYLFCFFTFLTFLLYYQSLNNFFVLDDFIRLKVIAGGSMSENFHFIPVPLIIYRILYLIFGLDPVPLRVLNYFINALTCLIIFKLSYRIFRQFDSESNENIILWKSLLISILFCIHYIHVETLVYFSELHELLYSLFYLTGLYSYFKYRQDKNSFSLFWVFLSYALCIFS